MEPTEDNRVREPTRFVRVLKVVNIVVFAGSLWFLLVLVALIVCVRAQWRFDAALRWLFLGLPDWAAQWVVSGVPGFVAEPVLLVAGLFATWWKHDQFRSSRGTDTCLLKLPFWGMLVAAATFCCFWILLLIVFRRC